MNSEPCLLIRPKTLSEQRTTRLTMDERLTLLSIPLEKEIPPTNRLHTSSHFPNSLTETSPNSSNSPISVFTVRSHSETQTPRKFVIGRNRAKTNLTRICNLLNQESDRFSIRETKETKGLWKTEECHEELPSEVKIPSSPRQRFQRLGVSDPMLTRSLDEITFDLNQKLEKVALSADIKNTTCLRKKCKLGIRCKTEKVLADSPA
ncbi:hypothetical protein EDI_252990 [Entamoeba dispar SAW760]|uniref:Uncharacterized protein n=1 Tax=Entamoeba dispar (strain ATCC PRA-260 / SAW760) TaxID=370354 RepID=B0EFA4_ENTDS|nr:uncharacterized protein EDI_252990 [Entamoeba dispar SAW760]EDR26834.1 hypothetical protein EDI_252990 [Entamoeba dispar SAW760]|eukprot:EDR26834.1 hypothetical protein EDI_252990 [Entamoeba dispar SAW760]